MKTLYLDCSMGAAGDMLTAALLELFPDPQAMVEELNHLGIPEVVFQRETAVKCGITGTYMRVKIKGREEEGDDREHSHDHKNHTHGHKTHTHEHHSHNSLSKIAHLVKDHVSLPSKVQEDIMAVYGLIAEAESKAHGVPVSQIHFHEVGTIDAVADIAAVCFLLHRLAPKRIIVSPIHVGSGQVACAHGILPVPAPATLHILKGAPIYGGSLRGELCTPTGAALLKYFATDFGGMPLMNVDTIGYGMGKKDFEAANCVRALLGETEDTRDLIYELSCTLDDMTGEAMGFAMEQLLAAGALDVYTFAVTMKKSRPGMVLQVLCKEEKKKEMINVIFKYTTTIGIRETIVQRYTLERRTKEEDTVYGKVRCKISSGYGVERKKYEYEDLISIAKKKNLSLEQILADISKDRYLQNQ